ncbi:MAG: RdgB/HAM1 family non-canonical purine NTP pyrophosphatase [Pseudomonadota bacterium]
MAPRDLVLASGNAGKLKEIQSILSDMDINLVAQTTLGVESVPETGTTFVENAIIKARHAAAVTGLPAIADDSGLAVDALGGQPGIYSARYAGEDASDDDNITLLLEALDGESHRVARFWCLIVVMRHAEDPTPLIAGASWQGVIATERAGNDGFGYDPVFYLPSLECTAAALPRETKNRLSHRGQALGELKRLLPGFLAVPSTG